MKIILFIIIIISLATISGCVEQQVSLSDTHTMRKTLSTVSLESTTLKLEFQDKTGLVVKEATPDDARGMYNTLLSRVGQLITIEYFYSEEIGGMHIVSVK